MHRQLDQQEGPSPRGRRNHLAVGGREALQRSIPAWAGKSRARRTTTVGHTVHPRVGGETPLMDNAAGSDRGSIPAWAGKPKSPNTLTRLLAVHPRVGGETVGPAVGPRSRGGPSPRGRGNLVGEITDYRSIPAWAGKPLGAGGQAVRASVHPRVGGENGAHQTDRDRTRSIPAWAGKPRRIAMVRRSVRVHPRVGGETWSPNSANTSSQGPSPRGRGNPRGSAASRSSVGSIPAWAGKPS